MRHYAHFVPLGADRDRDLVERSRPCWQRLAERYLQDNGEGENRGGDSSPLFPPSSDLWVCRDCRFVQRRSPGWSAWLGGWAALVALLLRLLLQDAVRLGCKAALLGGCWVLVLALHALAWSGGRCCRGAVGLAACLLRASLGFLGLFDVLRLLPKILRLLGFLATAPLLCCRWILIGPALEAAGLLLPPRICCSLPSVLLLVLHSCLRLAVAGPARWLAKTLHRLDRRLSGFAERVRGVNRKCSEAAGIAEGLPGVGVVFSLGLLPFRSCRFFLRCAFLVLGAWVWLVCVVVFVAPVRFCGLVYFTFRAEVRRLARL